MTMKNGGYTEYSKLAQAWGKVRVRIGDSGGVDAFAILATSCSGFDRATHSALMVMPKKATTKEFRQAAKIRHPTSFREDKRKWVANKYAKYSRSRRAISK